MKRGKQTFRQYKTLPPPKLEVPDDKYYQVVNGITSMQTVTSFHIADVAAGIFPEYANTVIASNPVIPAVMGRMFKDGLLGSKPVAADSGSPCFPVRHGKCRDVLSANAKPLKSAEPPENNKPTRPQISLSDLINWKRLSR